MSEQLASAAILPDGRIGAPEVAEGQMPEGSVIESRGESESRLAWDNGLSLLAHLPEEVGEVACGPPHPSDVIEHPGEILSLAKHDERLFKIAEKHEGRAQLEAEVDGSLVPGAGWREALLDTQGLLV